MKWPGLFGLETSFESGNSILVTDARCWMRTCPALRQGPPCEGMNSTTPPFWMNRIPPLRRCLTQTETPCPKQARAGVM